LMAYDDVRAINPCLREQCRALCEMEPLASIWPAAVCSASGAGGAAGAGTGAGGSAGTSGSAGAGGGGARPPKSSGGGGCAIAPTAPDLDLTGALVCIGSLLFWRLRRMRMFP